MRSNGKISDMIKTWFKRGVNYTIEEGKVISIRAQEAGHLTKLNAKRYKLRRDFDDICTEIGRVVVELPQSKKGAIQDSKSIQDLVSKASFFKAELRDLDKEIAECKKEYTIKVNEIHRKAA